MKNCIMQWKMTRSILQSMINGVRFSDAYRNEILAESNIYIELSAKNPLSKLDTLETNDLKNMPCILIINQAGQQEEQNYYENIIGLLGDFLFADTIQEARLKS